MCTIHVFKLEHAISREMKISRDTTYEIDRQNRPPWVTSDSTGQNVKIMDKETGLVFLCESDETEVLNAGNYIKITDINFFDVKISNESFEAEVSQQ